MRLAFHRLAAVELRDSRGWYANRSPNAAARFDDEVAAAIERVRNDPMALPIETKAYR